MVLYGAKATAFEQGEDGVVVTLLDLATRERLDVRAQYAQSRVRRVLGLPMQGRKNVYDSVSIVLNAT